MARPRRAAKRRNAARSLRGSSAEPVRQAIEADQFFVGLARADNCKTIAVDQHLGNEEPRIVGAGLHRAIGAGGIDGEQIARLRPRQGASPAEKVAALANRSDDVADDLRRVGLLYRADAMIGLVEGGPHEI